MPLQSLILFGKHPAWADHMSLGGGGELGGELKQQLYDRSVVAAAIREVAPERFADCVFIFQSRQQTAILTAVPSRDSIGRRQYPLFAGWVIDEQHLDALSAEFIEKLCADLKHLLGSLFVSSDSGAQLDQAAVEELCAAFRPSGENDTFQSSVANAGDFSQLLRALEDGNRALCLPAESVEGSLALAECACRQFKSRAEALLVIDRAEGRHGLFLSGQDGEAIPLGSFFDGALPGLRSGNWRETAKTRAVLIDMEDGQDTVAPAFCPVLNLTKRSVQKQPSFTIKWPWIAIGSGIFLVGLIILLFLFSPPERDETEDVDVTSPGLAAIRELWDSSSQDYVNWIVPLEDFVNHASPEFNQIKEFEALRNALKSPLNPFDVFGNPVVLEDWIEKPGPRIYNPENRELLKVRVKNIEVLKEALNAFYVALDVHAAVEVLDGKGILAQSWLSQNQKQFGAEGGALKYDEKLVRLLQARVQNYQTLNDLLKYVDEFETAILTPLKEQVPEFEAYVRRTMLAHLNKGAAGGHALDAYFEALSSRLRVDWLFQAGALDIRALRQSEGWPGRFDGELGLESIEDHMAFLKDYRVVDPSLLLDLSESLESAISRLESKMEKAHKRFPGESFLLGEEVKRLTDIGNLISTWSERTPIQKNYDEVQYDFNEISREVGVLDQRIDKRIGSLTDPSLWISERQPRIDSIRIRFLREWAMDQLQGIRQQHEQQKNFDAMEAYAAFNSDAENLFKALSRFETKLLELIDARLSSSSESLSPRVSDWIAGRMRDIMGEDPEPASMGKDFDRVFEEFQKEVGEFNREHSELEGIYAEMETATVSALELRERLLALKNHPFADPRPVVKKLSFLGASPATAAPLLADQSIRVSDLFWVLRNAVEQELISEELLRSAAVAFEAIVNHENSLKHLNSLGETWRTAFILLATKHDGHSRKMAELCAELDELIPESLQNSNHQLMKTVARFKLELMKSPNGELASHTEFHERAKEAADAGNTALAEFWKQVGDLRQNAAENTGNSLSRIVEGSTLIRNAEESEDRRRLTLDLGELALQFELIDGKEKPVFLSVSPLTIAEFFKLYRHAGFELEDFNSSWKLYPKTFEFGSRSGYSDQGVWQLSPGQSFDAFQLFDSDSQVMHIMQPELAYRLASALGLRLPTQSENERLLKEHSASAPPLAALDLSPSEWRDSLKREAFDYSVYAKQLKLVVESASWTGGVAFDQVEKGEKRFFDVAGGGAELAYDNGGFYASGNSWLFMQNSIEPQQLDREGIYVDLSVRFAIDPPKLSPREQIVEWIDLRDYLLTAAE